MANLNTIAELTWRQLFPNPTDEVKVKKEQFMEDAKTEYALQMWLRILEERRNEGHVEVPSYLLSEDELPVENGVMDISELKIMRGLPWETWLQNVGGVSCKCRYIKSTLNDSQLMCDDDSLNDGDKTYYVVGKKIKFPQGVHATPLPIIYANNGENVDGDTEVDDSIAGLVRRALVELYGGKVGAADKTNNSNPEV
jgi:hypothetical protein